MATASFFIDHGDGPSAYISGAEPTYRYIVVNLSGGRDALHHGPSLFLPHGPTSSPYARALAAELMRVADEFDALPQVETPASELSAPEPVLASAEDDIAF